MARRNRRSGGSLRSQGDRASDAISEPGRTISWRSCVLGLIAGEALLLVLTNVGLAAANVALGGAGRPDGVILVVSSLAAVVAGGFLAARLAGRSELYQGMVVGIGFIVVGAAFQFIAEGQIEHRQVAAAITSGSHILGDLGPMNMGALASGDFLALFAGSVGGLMGRRR